VSALVIPLIYQSLTLVQVTILESKKHPILVIQNRQQTIVINDQKPDTQKYLLTPFLAKAGINQITCDIDITKTNLSACQNTRWLSQDPPLLEVTVARSVWWILGAADQPLPPALTAQIPPQTFVWAGYLSDLSWLERLKPPTAIAVTPYVSQRLRERLKKQGIQVLFTGEEGFIQWQPQGFLPLSVPQDNLTVF
jgi:competence protein ComEC